MFDTYEGKQADTFVRTTKDIAGYVRKVFPYGRDIRIVVETLQYPAIKPPDNPKPKATMSETRIWEKMLDKHVKRTTYLTRNNQALYSIVWERCSKLMHQRVQAYPNFQSTYEESYGLKSLGLIKLISFNKEERKYLPLGIQESIRQFGNCYQGKNTSNAKYFQQFCNLLHVVLQSGGSVCDHPGVTEQIMRERGVSKKEFEVDTGLQKEIRVKLYNRFIAATFLLGAHRLRYGKLLNGLANDHLQGQNNYPKNISNAHTLLTN
jgi:hypothetical protein